MFLATKTLLSTNEPFAQLIRISRPQSPPVRRRLIVCSSRLERLNSFQFSKVLLRILCPCVTMFLLSLFGFAALGLAIQVLRYIRKYKNSVQYSSSPEIILEHVKRLLYIVREMTRFNRTLQESFWDMYRYDCAIARRPGSLVYQAIQKCVVVLVNIELSKVILTDKVNISKGFMYKLLDRWLADGLLTGSGHHWRTMRRLINPVFHRGALNRHNRSIIQRAEQFSQELIERSQVDVRHCTAEFTLSVLLKSIMGLNLEQFDKTSLTAYVNAVHTLSGLFTERALKPYYWPRLVYGFTESGRREARALATINGFVDAMIQGRLTQLQANPDLTGGALLDILITENIRNPTEVSFLDVRNQVNTFVFAGHDTSSAAFSFILYLVASMPEVQERIFEEVMSLCPEPREPLPDDCLPYLKYTEAVVKEALRLYPPVPSISRELDRSLDVGKGPLPAGTAVSVAISVIHKDPRLFPKPEEFIPERFLETDIVPGFIPFSTGPRNCIGQRLALNELILATATMIKNCSMRTRVHRDEIVVAIEIVIRAKTPLIVYVKERL